MLKNTCMLCAGVFRYIGKYTFLYNEKAPPRCALARMEDVASDRAPRESFASETLCVFLGTFFLVYIALIW